VQVLIVDEISMISAELFNELEIMARRLMGSTEPFGGIQLILSGDYFQCAP
jgi:ATP-dependent DNA helicase PIF1